MGCAMAGSANSRRMPPPGAQSSTSRLEAVRSCSIIARGGMWILRSSASSVASSSAQGYGERMPEVSKIDPCSLERQSTQARESRLLLLVHLTENANSENAERQTLARACRRVGGQEGGQAR